MAAGDVTDYMAHPKGLMVEAFTIESNGVTAVSYATRLGKIVFVTLTWAEDPGGAFVPYVFSLSGGTINIKSSGASAAGKKVMVKVEGYN